MGALQSARRLLDGRGGSIHVYSDEAGLEQWLHARKLSCLPVSGCTRPHLTRAERLQM